MRLFLLTTSLLTVLLFPGIAVSSNLEATFEGGVLNFNSEDHYLQISLTDLQIPLIQDSTFIERLFNNRPDYILCKLSIYSSQDAENSLATIIPFSLEKVSRNNYKYSTLDATNDYLLINSLKFPYDGSLVINVELLAWEDEENYSWAKKFYSSIRGMEVLTASVMSYIDIGLAFIEEVNPPKRCEDTIQANLAEGAISNTDYRLSRIVDGQLKNFMTIRFKTKEAKFNNANFNAAGQLPFFSDQKAWKKALREAAAQSLAANDPKNIRETLLAFSDYIADKPLTKKDKALYAAGALHNWVPDSLHGCIDNGCIKAGMYQSMPVGYLSYIRTEPNREWDIEGVDCQNRSCELLSNFIRKSYSRSGREQVKTQINEHFRLYVNGEFVTKVTQNDFVEHFEVTKVAKFSVSRDGMGGLIYTFPKGETEMFYTQNDNITQYDDHTLVIRQTLEGEELYITRIELDSRK